MSDTSIVTFTGRSFDFMNPDPDVIYIEDIAHALALINRYNGHTRVPYSVAEHCIRMSHEKMGNPLLNLIHDAAEAYIGDIPRPQKQDLGWVDRDEISFLSYRWKEDRVLNLILKKLCPDVSFSVEDWKTCKKLDIIMYVTEIRDIMPEHECFNIWVGKVEPLPWEILPWGWEKAEREYLKRFKELTV